MNESGMSIDDDMPSSLREMVKSNSQFDFFTEEGNKAKDMDSNPELSSCSVGFKSEEEASRQSQETPSAKYTVVGKSEK